ncbi:Hypothetical_protein [Hexamita inflata]|uniref:Hypothetical_protein n=1 Tax=Hexamita inflata TaxID=28002 RepID=A0ABP1H053_9EUKA
MQPTSIQYQPPLPSLAPQGDRVNFVPRNIVPPVISTHSSKQSRVVQNQFVQKISLLNSIRGEFSLRALSKQVFECELLFYQMLYRVLSSALSLLPFVCYLSTALSYIMLITFTVISLCQSFDFSFRILFMIRLSNSIRQNYLLVLRLLYELSVFIFGMVLSSSVIKSSTPIITTFKTELIVFGHYFGIRNLFYLFSNFVYKNNLKWNGQMVYYQNVNSENGQKISFNDFVNQIKLEKDELDSMNEIKEEKVVGKRHDTMDYE